MLRSAFSTLCNISLLDLAKHAIIQLENRPGLVIWQCLVSTFPQDSPICGGTLNTQRALQKTHVLHLQITREDLILYNKLSAPHGQHTYRLEAHASSQATKTHVAYSPKSSHIQTDKPEK